MGARRLRPWYLALAGSLGFALGCGKAQGSGSSEVDASSAALPEHCVPVAGTLSSPLIDDFEDGDDRVFQPSNRQGFWFADNDGTGTQAPAADPSGQPPLRPIAQGSPKSPGFALRTVGWGFQDWGAFVALRLASPARTGLCAYNASAYSGLKFEGKGSGALRVSLSTLSTTPKAAGGTCTAENCGDYGTPVPLGDAWTEVDVPFSSLSLPSWAASAPWEPAELARIAFWVETGDFDVWLDDVEFY